MTTRSAPIHCHCDLCQEFVRQTITRVCDEHPHFMGEWWIRFHGELGWVETPFYRRCLQQLVDGARLLKVWNEKHGYHQYLPAKYAFPRGKRGGA